MLEEDSSNNIAEVLLNKGEALIDKVEKQKGFPSLHGMEQ